MLAIKLATFLAVATSTLASPGALFVRETCSTGTVQCCNSIAPAGSTSSADLVGLIPIDLQGLNVPLGINCDPITAIGVGSGGSCSAQTACCQGNKDVGLVPVGVDCTPINASL
ncbi:fungal hydrophobin [Phellopilus nigrolimitatus]|nr:fungal hydrophobin [Phellopilus nigrolimitatus]